MKKTIILAAMIVAIASATSQNTDTVIRFGDRLPYLYYWDTNWIDRYMETNPEIYNYAYNYYNYRPVTYPGRSVFIGRACMTSKPLKIIGIAGHARIGNIPPEDIPLDTTIQGRVPEYFRLYVAEGDSVRFVAETRWDTATPNKSLEYPLRTFQEPESINVPLYEAYFNKPVIVDTLFFVGGTAFNNYSIIIPWTYPESAWNPLCPTTKKVYLRRPTVYSAVGWPWDIPDLDYSYSLYIDTNMNDERHIYSDNGENMFRIMHYDYGGGGEIFTFFAIFDTSYTYNPPDTIECLPPTGLRIDHIDTATATLTWNHQDSTVWQLQVFNADSIPDPSVYIDSLSVNMAILTDLDTAITYAARLRTICTSDTASEWTDTIQFRLIAPPDTSTGTTDIVIPQNTPVDIYTHLFPNPATSSLTVVSSFHLRRIEIFAANGSLILSSPVHGVSATVDISGLAHGTYIVRITTPSGTTTKRIVKK